MHVLAQVTAYDTYSAIFYFITLYFKSMSCNKNFINCNFFFFFLGPYSWPMEVPRLRVESELQLPACTTVIAVQDLSSICDLYHSSWQCRIPHPLNESRDRTRIFMDTSWIHFHCATMGTP